MLKNTSVRARIIVAFAFVLACTLGLGLFATSRLSQVETAVTDLSDNWLPSANALGSVAQSFELTRLRQLQVTVVPEGQRAEIAKNVEESRADLEKLGSFICLWPRRGKNGVSRISRRCPLILSNLECALLVD